MRLSLSLVLCLCAMFVVIPGCGGGPAKPSVSEEAALTPKSNEELKARLLAIGQSGEGGSAAAGLKPAVEAMRSSNAKLADELAKDLSALEASANPNDVKAIAARMAAKI